MSVEQPSDIYVTECDPGDPSVDAFVMAHSDGTPFHRPVWLAAVSRATGNKPHMLVARTAGGRVRGLLPLTAMRSRLFGRALVSTGFAVDGGLLAEPDAIPALDQAARDLALRLDSGSIDLRGGPVPGPLWHSAEDSHVGFIRPLAADDAAELSAIPRKHRAELRKALANSELRVEHGRNATLIRDHYHVYATSVRNLGTPVFPRALFIEMLAGFGEDADITVVYHRDLPVSAVLSLYHRGTVMPYWGGGVQEARGLRSNELLYFALMRHAHARGCTQFDFGRSKANSGQAAWKRSFGFEAKPLSYHHYSADGAKRDISPNSPKYQMMIAAWKKLPLPVANLIGPHLARGLG